jgi:monoamine oxidase
MPEQVEADVCIAGAGYAGLTAALRLTQAGMSVVVLEARDRVGGRIWTDHLADGTPIDRGGGWLAPEHDAMHRLADELGVATYKTWTAGDHLLVGGGRTRTYRGLIPKVSVMAVATIARAQMQLDRMAKRVPVEAPWTAARAAEWDSQTVAAWLTRSGLRQGIARDLFEMSVRGLFTGPLDDTSLLDLLFLVRSAGGFSTLMSIEGGYQENLVVGGAGTMAALIAEKLGDAVRLREPVRTIAQHDDRVVVDGEGVLVTARFAIVAIPPALITEIAFDPSLRPDRRALYEQTVSGPESKTLVVYDTPFWREDGRSGQSAGPGTAAEVTLDASPSSGNPGVLASFTFGAVAARIDALDPHIRRGAVLDELIARFGSRAARPVEYVETIWWEEEWTRGCSMAHFPPGVLTRYGRLLREPWGRIHWAGTETATVSHGAMDGAARSGERAAQEIIGRD